MKGVIYKIENIVTGRVYIGSSMNIERRFYIHRYELNKNMHKNLPLQHSYNKHGKEAFKFSIIEECETEKLIEREQYWFDFYKKNGKVYNIRTEVTRNNGIKFSKKARKKIGRVHKGKIISEEHRRKVSEANKGRHHTEEAKQKIGLRFKGTKLSEEHKQKIREAKKFISDETRKKLSESQKGKKRKPHTEEHKQKIREGNRGKIISEEQKQQVSAKLMGHPVSEETRQKIRERLKGKKQTKEQIQNALEGRMKRFKKDLP